MRKHTLLISIFVVTTLLVGTNQVAALTVDDYQSSAMGAAKNADDSMYGPADRAILGSVAKAVTNAAKNVANAARKYAPAARALTSHLRYSGFTNLLVEGLYNLFGARALSDSTTLAYDSYNLEIIFDR